MLQNGKYLFFFVYVLLFSSFSCSSGREIGRTDPEKLVENRANVVSVSVSGNEGDYHFSVEIQSPDTGCDQYANWWEVVSEDGDLIYRRILLHSHVNEQPFSRRGGPVNTEADQTVWIRAHMNNTGYGGTVLFGSVESGFEEAETDENFAGGLETTEPLPDGCAF